MKAPMPDFPKTHKEWEKPLVDLEEGIGKLRDLARREPDAERKKSLEARILDLESRADRARDTMLPVPSVAPTPSITSRRSSTTLSSWKGTGSATRTLPLWVDRR
jgi:hypothetical protein